MNDCPLCHGKGKVLRPPFHGRGWEYEPCPKCHPYKPEPRAAETACAVMLAALVLVGFLILILRF